MTTFLLPLTSQRRRITSSFVLLYAWAVLVAVTGAVADTTTATTIDTPQTVHLFSWNNDDSSTGSRAALLRKQLHDLRTNVLKDHSIEDQQVSRNSTQEQLDFLVQHEHTCVAGAAARFRSLNSNCHHALAQDLWKWCALHHYTTTKGTHAATTLLWDSHYSILNAATLKQLIADSTQKKKGLMVLLDNNDSSNGNGMVTNLLLWHSPEVALKMAQLLVNTDLKDLLSQAKNPQRFLAQALYNETNIGAKNNNDNNGEWNILHQSCSCESLSSSSNKGLCCMVYHGTGSDRVAVLGATQASIESPILPQHNQNQCPGQDHTDQPYLAKITRSLQQASNPTGITANTAVTHKTFYETLRDMDCLPSNACHKCLNDKKHGATCETCREECPCFCKQLCKSNVNTFDYNRIPEATTFSVTPPPHKKDPSRLIPRIIHQTWFEPIEPTKYPHLSRFVQSYKESGWEYKFYTDQDMEIFLEKHFPPQVKQAYDLIIPGAFKADLFRYCVLLIEGGVYADVDTLLGPSLDEAIAPDTGFMVGLDEPGKKVGARMCLWNGFLAAAPQHVFLAKTIETVVNHIHLRYTSLDMAQLHCPSPELSIIASYCTLFVSGPCILGSTINAVLGRYRQTPFEAGLLDTTTSSTSATPGAKVPGRTLILTQNKMDMGAHRFTLEETNLIVVSTDFPDTNNNDRDTLQDYEHYSETRIKFTTYGESGVYKDLHRNATALIRLLPALDDEAAKE